MKDLSLQAMSAEKWKSLRNERVNQKNFDSSAAAHVMHEEGSETLKKQIGKILLCGAVLYLGKPGDGQAEKTGRTGREGKRPEANGWLASNVLGKAVLSKPVQCLLRSRAAKFSFAVPFSARASRIPGRAQPRPSRMVLPIGAEEKSVSRETKCGRRFSHKTSEYFMAFSHFSV